jgi:hypothetical protein
MSQPTFTLWPWKIISFCIPIVACICAWLFHLESQVPAWTHIVFWSSWSAGNAYMLAVATGNFGRSTIAIPFGAFVGAISMVLLNESIILRVYLIFLAATMAALAHAGWYKDIADDNVGKQKKRFKVHPWVVEG